MSYSVLHVVGGHSFEGGTMHYVNSLCTGAPKAVTHLVWKHRNVPKGSSPDNIVRESRATLLKKKSVRRDLMDGLRDVLPLVRWARRNPTAILHAHSRSGILASTVAGRFVGNPVLVHYHFLARKWRLYESFRRATGAFAIFNSTLTRDHFNGKQTPHAVLEPFIDWPAEGRLKQGKKRRFVSAGALVPEKYPDLLLDAFHALEGGFPNIELTMFGASKDPMHPKFEKALIERSTHLPNTAILPWQSSWLDQLTDQDIFVHLGYPESFGLAMLETFARGIPLVVPPRSFFDDLQTAGQPVRDVTRLPRIGLAELREAMDQSLRSPPCQPLLMQERSSWRERFNADEGIQRLHELYDRLLRSRSYRF